MSSLLSRLKRLDREKRVRVHKRARELKICSKSALTKLQELGAKPHLIELVKRLYEYVADSEKIRTYFSGQDICISVWVPIPKHLESQLILLGAKRGTTDKFVRIIDYELTIGV